MAADLLDIAREVKKKTDKALKKAAIEVAGEMQRDFNMSLNQFYDAYHQKQYRRTYSTYKASSGNDAAGHFTDPKKMVTGGDGTYIVTLTVDGGRLPANAYPSNTGLNKEGGDKISASEIFTRVWDEGIHGFTAFEIPDFYKYYVGWTIPPQTTPTPDTVMNERFGRTSSGGHLDSIVSKYLKL